MPWHHYVVIDNWKAVMAWQPLLPDQVLVSLLDRCFFPRWLQTLTAWLNTSPNYDEVGVWYKGWKSVLPDRLISHPTVKGVYRLIIHRTDRL